MVLRIRRIDRVPRDERVGDGAVVTTAAVCVFAGYMTNSEDKQKIDDRQMRKRIARSIYNGIMAYGEMKGWTK